MNFSPCSARAFSAVVTFDRSQDSGCEHNNLQLTMPNLNSCGDSNARATLLANAFLDMRDELLLTSLLLQDLQFHLDSEKRNAAEKRGKKLLEKVAS